MAYDSRRRLFFFLSPVRAAFALLAAFFAPLLAAAFGGMIANAVAGGLQVFISQRGVSLPLSAHYARCCSAHNVQRCKLTLEWPV